MWKRFLVAGVFLFVGVSQGVAQEGGTYVEGKHDREIAGGSGNTMCLGGGIGCLFGPLGYLCIPMAGTEPPYSIMLELKNKSEDYKLGFREGYKGKKKRFYIRCFLWLVDLDRSSSGISS
ncbi:MAG: hypothetical protein QMD71_06870 [bacterium]|nr:hypothetical protein [bacterium]